MNLTLKPGQVPQSPQQAKLHQQATLVRKQVQNVAKTMAQLDNTSADSVEAKDAVSISDHISTGQKIKNALTLDFGNNKMTGAASFESETQELKSLDVNKEVAWPLWGGEDHRSIFQEQPDGSKAYYASNIGSGTLVHEHKNGTLFIEDSVWNYEGRDFISETIAKNEELTQPKNSEKPTRQNSALLGAVEKSKDLLAPSHTKFFTPTPILAPGMSLFTTPLSRTTLFQNMGPSNTGKLNSTATNSQLYPSKPYTGQTNPFFVTLFGSASPISLNHGFVSL